MSLTPRPEPNSAPPVENWMMPSLPASAKPLRAALMLSEPTQLIGREREGVLLGSAQHLRVDLGRCDGHVTSSRLIRAFDRQYLKNDASTLSDRSEHHPVARTALVHRRVRLGGLGQRPLLDPARAPRTAPRSAIVSSTSRDVPDGCPVTDSPALIRSSGLIGSGSGGDADDDQFALPGPARRRSAAIAAELAAVASTTAAPPSVCSAAATSWPSSRCSGVRPVRGRRRPCRRRGRSRPSRSPSPRPTARRGGPARRRRGRRPGRRPTAWCCAAR